MNALVVSPGVQRTAYALFEGKPMKPSARGVMPRNAGPAGGSAALDAVVRKACGAGVKPDVIGLRSPYGGRLFAGAVAASPAVLRRMRKLVPFAPLHLPPILDLVPPGGKWQGRPVVLAFETSFFAGLDAREASYALEAGYMEALSLRKYGFHGLLHEAACRYAAARRPGGGRRRILSLCLEPRPELAAVLDGVPVIVSGGATPLEGLPGESSVGDLDPGAVLAISGKLNLGAEEVNEILTRKSGIAGLLGRRVTLGACFIPGPRDVQLVRQLLLHRLLLAAGAGAAALGGLDVIVFSGRYAVAGSVIGPWLAGRLGRALRGKPPRAIAVETFRTPVERVIADLACAARAATPSRRAGP
jgi:acetate kinase